MEDIEHGLISLVILQAGIMVYNGQRNRHQLTQLALLPPRQAPWMQLLNYGDNSSFYISHTRPSFMELETVLFVGKLLGKRGRPTLLDDSGQLGFYLFFLGLECSTSICAWSLDDLPQLLLVTILTDWWCLCAKSWSDILWPRFHCQLRHSADIVRHREPRVINCIGFVDGVTIPVQFGSSPEEQGTNYNGYHHDKNVNNVFAFAPTGKIMWAAINAPRSWHSIT